MMQCDAARLERSSFSFAKKKKAGVEDGNSCPNEKTGPKIH
jgi:hypothetical protein